MFIKEDLIPQNKNTILCGSPASGSAMLFKTKFIDDLVSNKNKSIILFDVYNELKNFYDVCGKYTTIIKHDVIDKNLINKTLMNPFILYVQDLKSSYEEIIWEKKYFLKTLLLTLSVNPLTSGELKEVDTIIFELYKDYIKYLKENNLNYSIKKAPTFDDVCKLLENTDPLLANLFSTFSVLFCQEVYFDINLGSYIVDNKINRHNDAFLNETVLLSQLEVLKNQIFVYKQKTSVYIPKANYMIYRRPMFEYFIYIQKQIKDYVDFTLELVNFEFENNDERHIEEFINIFDYYYISNRSASMFFNDFFNSFNFDYKTIQDKLDKYFFTKIKPDKKLKLTFFSEDEICKAFQNKNNLSISPYVMHGDTKSLHL